MYYIDLFTYFELQSLQSEWRLVFWITFFTHIAKIAVFTTWGSGEVQPWNDPEPRRDVTTDKLVNKYSVNIKANYADAEKN